MAKMLSDAGNNERSICDTLTNNVRDYLSRLGFKYVDVEGWNNEHARRFVIVFSTADNDGRRLAMDESGKISYERCDAQCRIKI